MSTRIMQLWGYLMAKRLYILATLVAAAVAAVVFTAGYMTGRIQETPRVEVFATPPPQ